LNQANYVAKKGRGRPVVIHIDRLRKLPTKMDTDNTSCPASDSSHASPPAKRRKADTTAAATGTSPADTSVCRPLTCSTDHRSSQGGNVCMDTDSTDTGDDYLPVTVSQSTDTATAATAATAESTSSSDRPRPVPASRAARERRRPARFLETVQACRLTYHQSAVRASGRLAGSDVSAADNSHLHCSAVSVWTVQRCLSGFGYLPCSESSQSCVSMPRSCILRRKADWSDSGNSDAESTTTVMDNPTAGGQMAPSVAPATEPGPMGAPPWTVPPPPTAESTSGDWGIGVLVICRVAKVHKVVLACRVAAFCAAKRIGRTQATLMPSRRPR